MTTKQQPKRRGRPRNDRLDELQAELAITRRHARRLLKESDTAAAAAPGASAPGLSPIASARLQKLLAEIERIGIAIEQERLTLDTQRRELIPLSEAMEIMGAPHRAVAATLATAPRQLSHRLAHRGASDIELELREFCDALLRQLRESI